jgi:hypothetical protein
MKIRKRAGECWAPLHRLLAGLEGWNLFTPSSTGRMEIEREDEDPAERWSDDTEATLHVLNRAADGSRLHQLAVRLMGHAPDDEVLIDSAEMDLTDEIALLLNRGQIQLIRDALGVLNPDPAAAAAAERNVAAIERVLDYFESRQPEEVLP